MESLISKHLAGPPGLGLAKRTGGESWVWFLGGQDGVGGEVVHTLFARICGVS